MQTHCVMDLLSPSKAVPLEQQRGSSMCPEVLFALNSKLQEVPILPVPQRPTQPSGDRRLKAPKLLP